MSLTKKFLTAFVVAIPLAFIGLSDTIPTVPPTIVADDENPLNQILNGSRENNDPTFETYRSLDLYGKVFERIRRDYVDKDKISDEELTDAAIRAMVKKLDRFSMYFNKTQFDAFERQLGGSYEGIGAGIAYDEVKKAILITGFVGVNPPAQKAGLKVNDLIVVIDGHPTSELDTNGAIGLLVGKANTTVTVKVLREGEKKPLDIVITRGKVEMPTVYSNVYSDVMYVRLFEFNNSATSHIKTAIQELAAKKKDGINGYKGLILDMRSNPGGYLDQAASVSDLFLNGGVIVYTKGRKGVKLEEFDADSEEFIPHNMPIVILINGGTASAAEIVSAALQDHKRAALVGTLSFGKGSVQTVIRLNNGGALKLTIAKYYTKSGRTIHKHGVMPDIEIALPKDALIKDGVVDVQIQKALDVILKKQN